MAQGRWPASRSHAQAAAAAEGRQEGGRAAREGIGGAVPIAYELAAELADGSKKTLFRINSPTANRC